MHQVMLNGHTPVIIQIFGTERIKVFKVLTEAILHVLTLLNYQVIIIGVF